MQRRQKCGGKEVQRCSTQPWASRVSLVFGIEITASADVRQGGEGGGGSNAAVAGVQQIGVLKAVILTCQKCASHVATIRPPVNATQPRCERKRALQGDRAMRTTHCSARTSSTTATAIREPTTAISGPLTPPTRP